MSIFHFTDSVDSSRRSEVLDGIKRGFLLGAAVLAVSLPPAGIATPHRAQQLDAAHLQQLGPRLGPHPHFADFAGEQPSAAARHIADWAVDSRDHGRMSFVIVDKKNAHVWVFGPDGRLRGGTPVLLGAAAGDLSVAGIGQRPISEVRPEERTTPAGRFIAEPGRNALGEDVVWVDYNAAVSMHRVRVTDPRERRLERLASPTTEDNRISYGCINMPVAFFEGVLSPTFKSTRAVVYVLPETLDLDGVFGSYDVAERHRRPATIVAG